jgi:hypothetical protein
MSEAVHVSVWARRAQILVAVVVGAALLLRFGLTTFRPDPEPDSPELLVRWVRFFSYFTIQSNIVVLLAALAVIFRPDKLGLPWYRGLRLISVVGITVTAVVYNVILAKDDHDTGLSLLANNLLHRVGPAVFILAWLAFGPWSKLTFRDIPRAMAWPLAWLFYTVVHGLITGWWPYGFIDIDTEGASTVAVNIGAIIIFALALAVAYLGIARLREGGGPPPDAEPAEPAEPAEAT